jgi:cytochrome c oxidase cbb3-type subunit 3
MMSHGWSIFVTTLALLNVIGCGWLVWWTTRPRTNEVAKGEVIDHVWDGDLQERNSPLPRWWLILFFLSMAFCFVYLTLYPGLGTFRGLLGWSKESQYQQEMAAAKLKYDPIYASFAGREIVDLATDPRALALGRSLFANNCIACHGSDARGAPGFPDLTDNDWLYGGAPANIVESITHGRQGVMPPLGAVLGEQGVREVVSYVLSLSGREAPADEVAAGKSRFVLCAACHGADGKGNQDIGAPNLTDQIWLYGGSRAAITKSVVEGRLGKMPAHDWLGQDKIRLLAAYLYSLSHEH